MFNYIHSFFKKKKPQTKVKSLKERLLELPLGSYAVFDLNPDICIQHLAKNINRFDQTVLNNRQLKGLVKAVYTTDTTKCIYVEVVGLVINGENTARKEYVAMESDIHRVTIIGH